MKNKNIYTYQEINYANRLVTITYIVDKVTESRIYATVLHNTERSYNHIFSIIAPRHEWRNSKFIGTVASRPELLI